MVKTALRRLAIVACALLAFLQAPAHAQRLYQSAELEALLAPIALYPDALIADILVAATHPAEVMDAAQAAAPNPAWHPSVQALLAFPDILSSMASSPQWLFDLGNAYLAQPPQVMAAIQLLRERAQASGSLQSSDQQQVQQYGATISVQPAIPQVVYAPYYDPLVVYGAWRPAYRVVQWRPWPTRRVFVTNGFQAHSPQHAGIAPYVRVPEANRRPIVQSQSAPPIALRGNGPPSVAAQMQGIKVTPYVRIPEANRQPIIQSAPRLEPPHPQHSQQQLPQHSQKQLQQHSQQHLQQQSRSERTGNGRRGS